MKNVFSETATSIASNATSSMDKLLEKASNSFKDSGNFDEILEVKYKNPIEEFMRKMGVFRLTVW